jgi:hypothetical protein
VGLVAGFLHTLLPFLLVVSQAHTVGLYVAPFITLSTTLRASVTNPTF